MKKLLIVCLFPLIVSCASKPTPVSHEKWEYAPHKWIGFNKKIELAWNYDVRIDSFEIDREKFKIEDDVLAEIHKLLKKRDREGLVEIENRLRVKYFPPDGKIKYDGNVKIVKVSQPSQERAYIDQEDQHPDFGEICFYQISAWKDGVQSPHAEVSMILVKKLK